MNTSAASPVLAAPVAGRSLAAWWQAMPLTLVFVLFFLVPLALIGMVSFWDFNEYELLPAFTAKHYLAIFDGCSNTTDMCVTFKTYLSTF
jgi:putative spermidine/putrescine transport system permease protein